MWLDKQEPRVTETKGVYSTISEYKKQQQKTTPKNIKYHLNPTGRSTRDKRQLVNGG